MDLLRQLQLFINKDDMQTKYHMAFATDYYKNIARKLSFLQILEPQKQI